MAVAPLTEPSSLKPQLSCNTHDPYAALHIEHNTLEEYALKLSAGLVSADSKAFHGVPFPDGTAPKVLDEGTATVLPTADIILITYTNDEANAMSALLTPGFLAAPPKNSGYEAWTSYTHLFDSYLPDLLHGSSPALNSHNLGLFKLVQIGTKRVLCFKSSLHLARDGKSMPIKRLVTQILKATNAGLIITTGTAGGIGNAVQLGDAAITTSCYFDLVRLFKSETFNKTTIKSNFVLNDAKFIEIANQQLIPINADRLKSSPIPPSRVPEIVMGDAVFEGERNICVTTDGFLYDDATNTYSLQGKGCMVEMDDAVVGLAVQELGNPNVKWLSIRNASDPQMPIGTTKKESSDIYMKYGFYTSFTSVLACWACVLGVS